MKVINNFNSVKPYSGDFKRLPVGAYICGIREAIEVDYSGSIYLQVKFDISEGDYKSFFDQQYKEDTRVDRKYKGFYRLLVPDNGADIEDGSMRRFKTFIDVVEQSNPGFKWNWDESLLRGKLFGGLFGEKEYEFNGRSGTFVTLRNTIPIADVKNGNYTVPDVWKLNGNDNITKAKLLVVDDGGTLPF